MMTAMDSGPPDRRALKAQISAHNEEILDPFGAVEGPVRQQAMVAYRDAKHVIDIKGDKQEGKFDH